MNKERLNEVKELTKHLYHEYSQGNYTPWFNTLHKDCVWTAISDPMLIGANRIIEYFTKQDKYKPFNIITESYTSIKISESIYVVNADIHAGFNMTISSKTQMTFVYKYYKDTPKLVYQNNAYDFVNSASLIGNDNSYKDLAIRMLIKQFAKDVEYIEPIAIKTAQQTFYVSPLYIIYIQSQRHKTIIHCVDKDIECIESISALQNQLPDYFYNIRRGCIINTKYVVGIKRVEVELVNGVKIQVPVPSYTKVKKDIEDMIL